MADPIDWTKFVRINGNFTAAQRTRVQSFFNRLASTPAGSLLLQEVQNRSYRNYQLLGFNIPGMGGYSNPLTITGVDKADGKLGFFLPGTSSIGINLERAFSTTSMTHNTDGSADTFEQTLLHELVHYILDDNIGMFQGGTNFTRGAFASAAASQAAFALAAGKLSQADYDYIVAPYRTLIDGEIQAESVSNRFYNEIFGPRALSDYYLPYKRTSGSNTFDYSADHPTTSAAEMTELRGLMRSSSGQFTSKLDAFRLLDEVARRAAEKKVINPDNLNFIRSSYRSVLGKSAAKGRNLLDPSVVATFTFENGEIVGLQSVRITDGGRVEVVASTRLVFARVRTH